MPELDPIHKALLTELVPKLDKNGERTRLLNRYVSDDCPLPEAVERAGVTRAYNLLMPTAQAPFASVVVDAVQDRLELAGIETGNPGLDKVLWEDFRANGIDAEAALAHDAALAGIGRSYATVWPTAVENPTPSVTLDSSEQMIVKYAEGSRSTRVAACRRWDDEDDRYATLYLPDGIYKFVGKNGSTTAWEQREVSGEDWPLQNPLNVVPVVELAVNRRLNPGSYPYARGEFQNCIGLIDRINLLSFLGLVVAFWMGFPLRGVIGEKIAYEILKDDDGNPLLDSEGKPRKEAIPPVDVHADSFFQFENPDAKLAEFQAADRKNLSIYEELEQLASVTKTPRHYFPMQGGGSNISADTIIAYEGGLHAKVGKHKGSLGQGWEEVARLCAKVRGQDIPATSRIRWKDHETRSLAERADAATKLKDLLPWQALAEKVLNASNEDIGRWQGMRAMDPMNALIEAAENGEQTG